MHADPTIRRRDNGTIDIDFYRQRALVERAETSTQFMKTLGHAMRPLIGVAVVAGIFMAALSRSAPPVCAYALYGAVAAPPCPADLYANNEPHQRRSS